MSAVLIVLADDLDRGVPGLAEDPEVADALLAATMDLARKVGGVGRVLLFHPSGAEGRLAARSLGFRLWPCDGDTPGRRYANAFRQASDLGYEGALVVGLGVPDIDPARLGEALELLGENQGVLIEDDRGGIAVLGLQRDEPHLFPTGGERPDAEAVRVRARQQRVRLHELAPHRALTADDVAGFLAARR
jgi:glycosyltransferase A (GT-A) superfamily protein (DUF2064 family)